MGFSKKIFIALFFTSLVLGSAILWVAHNYVASQNQEAFISRYSVFSTVLGDTLSRLDTHTEALMLNAAKVIFEKDKSRGTLSTEELKKLRGELSVTHLFVVDRQGNFIRSTNEYPKLIPNAFTFCPAYRNLYANSNSLEATPVVHPFPEPKPYKFLYVSSYDHQRLIEVGVRVDFVANTLTEALGADSNLTSLSLFAPTGLALGQFKAKGVEFPGNTISLPEKFPAIVSSGDELKIYTKVTSSHPQCCQCNITHTSKNGEYYYVLESRVSKDELRAIQASTGKIFFGLMLGNLIMSLIFSRFLSRRLVKNIELAVTRVRQIKEHGDITQRIHLPGKDEVAYLTSELDNMMDSLQDSQQKIVAAAKIHTKIQMAREVAHNMKSPAIAIEVALPFLIGVPESLRKVLKNSAREIKDLADRLKKQSDENIEEESADSLHIFSTPIALLIERTIQEKKVEYLPQNGIDIKLEIEKAAQVATLSVDPIEFRAVLSNLINNAVESYSGNPGAVHVSIKTSENALILRVQDFGRGIPEDLLERLGKECLTFDKPDGTGLGLLHMYRMVSSWGAEVAINSKINIGTTISIRLPYSHPNLRQTNQTAQLNRVNFDQTQ